MGTKARDGRIAGGRACCQVSLGFVLSRQQQTTSINCNTSIVATLPNIMASSSTEYQRLVRQLEATATDASETTLRQFTAITKTTGVKPRVIFDDLQSATQRLVASTSIYYGKSKGHFSDLEQSRWRLSFDGLLRDFDGSIFLSFDFIDGLAKAQSNNADLTWPDLRFAIQHASRDRRQGKISRQRVSPGGKWKPIDITNVLAALGMKPMGGKKRTLTTQADQEEQEHVDTIEQICHKQERRVERLTAEDEATHDEQKPANRDDQAKQGKQKHQKATPSYESGRARFVDERRRSQNTRCILSEPELPRSMVRQEERRPHIVNVWVIQALNQIHVLSCPDKLQPSGSGSEGSNLVIVMTIMTEGGMSYPDYATTMVALRDYYGRTTHPPSSRHSLAGHAGIEL